MWTSRVNFWNTRTSTWKNVDLYASFSEKVDLYLRNVDLYVWFSEKSGPRPKNVDLLHMISEKFVKFSEKSEPWPEKCGHLLKKRGPRPKNVDLLHMISEKFGPSCWIFWNKWTLKWRIWILEHHFLKKWTSIREIWTFKHEFLKKSGPWPEKVDLDLKIRTIHAWFSEKWGPWSAIFWKKWTPIWKIWSITIDFLKKNGPHPEKFGPLHMIFWKKVDLNLKMWTFTRHFLKKMNLYLRNVDHIFFFRFRGLRVLSLELGGCPNFWHLI